MKKRLSWKLLILALLLTLTVFSVAAADTQQAPEVTHATIPVQINPLYEDLYENLMATVQGNTIVFPKFEYKEK